MGTNSLWTDIRNLPDDSIKTLSRRVKPTPGFLGSKRIASEAIRLETPVDKTEPASNRKRTAKPGRDKVKVRKSRLALEADQRDKVRHRADKAIGRKLNPKGLSRKQRRKAFRSPA